VLSQKPEISYVKFGMPPVYHMVVMVLLIQDVTSIVLAADLIPTLPTAVKCAALEEGVVELSIVLSLAQIFSRNR
jgi:hypothetical protein